MPRYVAFLRGVSPMNLRMADLRDCLEAEGLDEVRTLLSSGNAVFSTARARSTARLETQIESALQAHLGRSFTTFVRPVREMQALVESDAFAGFDLAPGLKPVISFLRQAPDQPPALPLARGDSVVLALRGTVLLSAYREDEQAPGFMQLIERHFGSEITTRTLDTVRKCAWA